MQSCPGDVGIINILSVPSCFRSQQEPWIRMMMMNNGKKLYCIGWAIHSTVSVFPEENDRSSSRFLHSVRHAPDPMHTAIISSRVVVDFIAALCTE